MKDFNQFRIELDEARGGRRRPPSKLTPKAAKEVKYSAKFEKEWDAKYDLMQTSSALSKLFNAMNHITLKTDADPDYSHLNPSKPKPEFKHPAFKTMYQYDEPGYDDNQQIRQIQDRNYTRSKVAKDNNIQFQPRQDIYNLNTSQANKERDERIATGKSNIKNIEIKRKLNKATGNTTDTPTDSTQKKFARDIMQNNTGNNQKK